MRLGRSLERDQLQDGIEEGKDVYFECDVVANPAAFEILWKHNVSYELLNLPKVS
jgi:hypothetical protein